MVPDFECPFFRSLLNNNEPYFKLFCLQNDETDEEDPFAPVPSKKSNKNILVHAKKPLQVQRRGQL
jgi:hypothetical protein